MYLFWLRIINMNSVLWLLYIPTLWYKKKHLSTKALSVIRFVCVNILHAVLDLECMTEIV